MPNTFAIDNHEQKPRQQQQQNNNKSATTTFLNDNNKQRHCPNYSLIATAQKKKKINKKSIIDICIWLFRARAAE